MPGTPPPADGSFIALVREIVTGIYPDVLAKRDEIDEMLGNATEIFVSAAAFVDLVTLAKQRAEASSISAAASARLALSGAVTSSVAMEFVKAARLEVFDTASRIEQLSQTAEEQLAAVRVELQETQASIEATATDAENSILAAKNGASAFISAAKDSGIEAIEIAKTASLGELETKESEVIAVIDGRQASIASVVNTYKITALAAIENAKSATRQTIASDALSARQNIAADREDATDAIASAFTTALSGVQAAAQDTIEELGDATEAANTAVSTVQAQKHVLDATIEEANIAYDRLNDPNTFLNLLYVDAFSALYVVASQAVYAETLVKNALALYTSVTATNYAIDMLNDQTNAEAALFTAACASEYVSCVIQTAVTQTHTYVASVFAAESEADRVAVAGYKTDVEVMKVDIIDLVARAEYAAQNAEFNSFMEVM